MSNDGQVIDVLMCCGPADISYLFPLSLQCCLKYFVPLGRLTVVTPAKHEALVVVNALGPSATRRVRVLHDDDVLPPHLRDWPGWYKQQFLKLMADLICGTSFVACLGADTIMLTQVDRRDLFDGEIPFLFYNRYPTPAPHLAYERRRVKNVARLLGVEPQRSLSLGDFVMDFTIFSAERLVGLRKYIESRYGKGGLAAILQRECETLEQKAQFGEWTLHAVYLLDVLNAPVPLCNSRNQFVAQIHSQNDYTVYNFDSSIVHFVSKSFDINDIVSKIKKAKIL